MVKVLFCREKLQFITLLFNKFFLFVVLYAENEYFCNRLQYINLKMTGFNLKEFTDFFTEYQQRFVYFATTYLHDEAVAEDLVIESMMYFWEHRERLADDTNVPAYVLTTLRHKSIDYLRHQKTAQDAHKEINDLQQWDLTFRMTSLQDFDPNNIFIQEIQEIVDRTLESLPERTREIFRASRFEDKTYKEIARQEGITVKAVEFHITKSNEALRNALKDYLPLWAVLFYFPI